MIKFTVINHNNGKIYFKTSIKCHLKVGAHLGRGHLLGPKRQRKSNGLGLLEFYIHYSEIINFYVLCLCA